VRSRSFIPPGVTVAGDDQPGRPIRLLERSDGLRPRGDVSLLRVIQRRGTGGSHEVAAEVPKLQRRSTDRDIQAVGEHLPRVLSNRGATKPTRPG
jgi:hypothetical protein